VHGLTDDIANKVSIMLKVERLLRLISACSVLAWAQSTAPSGTPARILLTIGHHYGHPPSVLTKDDFTVHQQYDERPVTGLVPLRGDRAALELFVLVDNGSNSEMASNFDDLNKFIRSQPQTTSVGVAYITEGKLKIAKKPSLDRETVIKALSPPSGSQPADPFDALADLIKGWPENSSRHVVLMISNGVNPAAPDNRPDPSAEAAIDAAERAGVAVYAIYHPSFDYRTNEANIYSGQVRLAHVGIETGGEAYFLSLGPLPSLTPFLADIGDHLANQYWLEFLSNPCEGSGALQQVKVDSKIPDMELVAPDSIWVPGRRLRTTSPRTSRAEHP